jgi:sulfatase modifying factor 1
MKTQTRAAKLSLGVLALGLCVTAQAASPAIANIAMVPRLTIQSDVGSTNQVQYSTDLNQTNWTVLTNLVVTQSPFWFVDLDAPPAPHRFYRVVALTQTNNPTPLNMALIPAGSFTMGDALGEWTGQLGALPLHSVYVSAFYMDQYLVTKALWDEVSQWATNHGYRFDFGAAGKAPNHPAQNMTWYDAVKWCNARSEKEGRVPAYYTSVAQTTVYRSGLLDVSNGWIKWNVGYRLPTEAEWEKAARGGATGHRFPWSDSDLIRHSRANYNSYNLFSYDVSSTRGFHPAFNDGVYPYTSPVGYFGANDYGLYDMAGNVYQWCWDWADGSYYGSSPGTDPHGPASALAYRVVRGGSWYEFANRLLCAARWEDSPDYRDNKFGFRCVLLPGQP